MIKEPTFDVDGYPTEETLQQLQEWPIEEAGSALDFLAAAWHWADFGVSRILRPAEAEIVHAELDDHFLRLATGGWSGNEDLIAAFDKSYASILTWRLSTRGGLHIYQYPSK